MRSNPDIISKLVFIDKFDVVAFYQNLEYTFPKTFQYLFLLLTIPLPNGNPPHSIDIFLSHM